MKLSKGINGNNKASVGERTHWFKIQTEKE